MLPSPCTPSDFRLSIDVSLCRCLGFFRRYLVLARRTLLGTRAFASQPIDLMVNQEADEVSMTKKRREPVAYRFPRLSIGVPAGMGMDACVAFGRGLVVLNPLVGHDGAEILPSVPAGRSSDSDLLVEQAMKKCGLTR